MASKALGDSEPTCILPQPADIDNQNHEDDVWLDAHLTEFAALNHTRLYPNLYSIPDAPELVKYPRWRRARAEILRWAVLLVARLNRVPDWLSDAVIDYAFEVHHGH